MTEQLVLVTGGTGFIGVHTIAQLLQQGYPVRTTVRSAAREGAVRAMLDRAGVPHGDRLCFAVADLEADGGWPEATAGCTYVLHIASPFPAREPKDPEVLIRPAREGALRVLRAARDAGVKRVVLTSSYAAIGYGHAEDKIWDETSWTELDGPGVGPYVMSKTLAEKAAWDFVQEEGGTMELVVVNPVGVTGPAWGKDLSTSIEIVKRLIDGAVPGIPRLSFGLVDVRDVADLHLRAMVDPRASGERFLAVSGESITIKEIADTLRSRMGTEAKRVPTRMIPDFALRIAALFDASLRQVTPTLGKRNAASSAKAESVLGWKPMPIQDSVVDTARALIDLGLTKR